MRAARTEAPDPRPTRDGFDTPDAYETALTEWGVREGQRKATQAAAEERKAAETKAAEERREVARKAGETELAKLAETWQARRAKAIEARPDYAAVAESDAVTISQPMAHAIMSVENGPDIAYHLGQHPDVAARIAGLANVGMQILEIGKLSAKLAATPDRRPPPPPPLDPISGVNARADTSDREPSMEEYAAKRTAEIRASRRPFIQAS